MIQTHRRRWRLAVTKRLVCSLLAFGTMWCLTAASAEDSSPKPKLTAVQQQRLKERDAFKLECRQHRQAGKLAEAIEATQKMLAIEREVFGEEHDEVLDSMDFLAQRQRDFDDFAAARKTREEILEIRRKVSGIDHWRTADARRDLEHVNLLEKLSPDDRREVLRANVLNSLAERFTSLGQHADAEPLYRQALKIRQSVLGEQHPDCAICLNNLAELYESMADYAKAEPLRRQALDIRQKVLGENHPDYATSLNNLAWLYNANGETAKAEPLLRQALEINRAVLGETHPGYATGLNNLAAIYNSRKDFAKAEPLYEQALGIRQKVLGEKHPNYAMSLNNLAALYYAMGDYAKAEPLFRQALEIHQSALGETHPAYANGLNNLAELYNAMGDYALAEPLYRQALEINRKVLGEKHPDYAISLSNLAGLYNAMEDYAVAEPLYRQALDIRQKVLGEKHPDYAASLNNLAWLYNAMGDSPKAEPLFQHALEINRTVLGEKHPDYAISLNNLAELYFSMGDSAKAEPLFRQALDIRKTVLSEAHPAYATGLSNLAMLYASRKEDTKVEPLLRQVLTIQAAALGEKHPAYATSLSNLAGFYEFRGKHALAEPLVRQSVAITRQHVETTAAVQSERQQFVMAKANRGVLSLYLSVAVSSEKFAEDVYQEVLLTKGSVWRRQQKMRAVQGDSQLAPLFTEFRSVAARRAQQTLTTPDPKTLDVWRRQIDQLTQRQEELERELSSRSATYRQVHQSITVEELRANLPVGHALVDFWEYSQLIPHEDGKTATPQFERRLVAFVVRPEQPSVTLVPLGAVKPLAQAIDTWRQANTSLQTFGQSAQSAQAGQLLRERLWTPLEPHLTDAKMVLVSPDGVLGRFPLIALPGNKLGSYLLEDRALAIVPVPQALVSLLRRKDSDRPAVAGNLLVLGDVDYDALPDAPAMSAPKKKFGRNLAAVRGTDWRGFTPLDATRGELATIEKLYRTLFGADGVTLLEKAEANEKRFLQEAPRHKFLHVATHGFFAPESLRSALKDSGDRGSRRNDAGLSERVVGYPPGLLSGLALAGANRPHTLDQDDGILTASEVENLDLRGVQLVVLSACETGLGEVAGGEGLLGLQRAFQVAGTQTVVASLWPVSDNATRSLMERFYENLLKKEMGTLESLREAQLWMLKEGQERGLVRINKPEQPDDAPVINSRTPPFYWAAFVLSGDWR